jgi:hypothetical protein
MRCLAGILCVSILFVIIGCGDDEPTGSETPKAGSILIHLGKNFYPDTATATVAAEPKPQIKWQVDTSVVAYVEYYNNMYTSDPIMDSLKIIVARKDIDYRLRDTLWYGIINEGTWYDPNKTYSVTFSSNSDINIEVRDTLSLTPGETYTVRITYKIYWIQPTNPPDTTTPFEIAQGVGFLTIQ